MGNDWISLCKAQHLRYLTLLNLVHIDFSETALLVFHIDKVLAIEVKRYAILSELQVIRSMLYKHVFF